MIDIGVNLMDRAFSADRDAVVQRAREQGVQSLIITGTSLKNSEEAFLYSQSHPYQGITSTAGIHPHNAHSYRKPDLLRLQSLLQHDSVVAVGECGLDFNRNFSSQEEQLRCFEAQLELAESTEKPLFLHERDAHDLFLSTMKRHPSLIPRSVVHCFTGDENAVLEYLDAGFFIGITGWLCNERRSSALRQAVRHIPLDRIMIETDAPYLTPRNAKPFPTRGRNEPALLPYVLDTLSQCMGVPPSLLEAATQHNTEQFFALKKIANVV